MRLTAALLALVACGPPDDGADPVAYTLPLACGAAAVVGQGNFGEFSHHGLAAYAFDLLLPRGTPVHAMADGVVIHLFDETGPGDPCRDGGDESCFALANLVVLLHADGAATLYKHLDAVRVAVGDEVARGALVGLSGATGWSTRPHLHVARMEDCGGTHCQTLPLAFVEAGVPVTGERVTACP